MLSHVPARVSLVLAGMMFLLRAPDPCRFFPLNNFYTECLALALGLPALAPSSARGFWNEVKIPTPNLRLPGFAALLLVLIGERDALLLQLERAAAVFPERPQSFAAVVEKAANLEPDAFGEISRKVRQKLKQADRNGW